ncbi:fused DSP-PTPase phosphatase/NAD kinase-like protein [Gymnodinialimonas hymeniacidonis]|uniref:fused DSP-PTPase phosphatase/NAD kinase-like protein n=1 Tax=Gymnodinialimonas hymeniacidonis TaxID=3126508 RepID=UPI0034C6B799
MALTFMQKLHGALDVARGRYDQRIDSDLGLWQGRYFAAVNDHGLLRRHWRNEGEVAPGLFRANHPDENALRQWKARGIVEVISLRPAQFAVHEFEARTCEALGLRLRNVPLEARSAPRPERLLSLLDIFDTLERPALIHCKSGADRTGLAAALWGIHIEGHPVAEAKRALGLRHLHLSWSKTGVLDRFLDAYQDRLKHGDIPIRLWIETEYDPSTL